MESVSTRGGDVARSASSGGRGRSAPVALLKHLLLILGGVIMVLPLAMSIFDSLKQPGAVLSVPPTLLPSHWEFGNYIQLFRTVPFFQWFLNSTIIAVLGTGGAILSSTLCGYAFARLRFPGRDALFLICIATMMLPGVVTLIPQFIVYRHLGLIDTFVPLILPSWLGIPFYIFLSRQTFRTVPKDYEDAAHVDGASNWYIWWRIMLPMSKSMVATIAIFSVIANWNDFLNPLIYLNSASKMTLALGLQTLDSFYGTQWDLIMAGAVLMTLPMIVIFFVAQRYFMSGGISFSGLGGR
ncbi:MAG TPA: carbohydrate ABC transporter permease [Candidatus Dormibacteraeota bacterium]|jgi:multiple sugar transport system permease protein|nr:carbohydrate ABC transporter permease [Candidatus Dormibacteraeota bacterium]